jgi:16S rRNA (cytosine967-C5)-methyltransferase
VKPGGRLAYITCSVLPPENRDQVEGFLSRFPQYGIVPWPDLWQAASLSAAAPPQSADGSGKTLLMTPRSFATDGFFVAVLERK